MADTGYPLVVDSLVSRWRSPTGTPRLLLASPSGGH